jgi:hypothetical protein
MGYALEIKQGAAAVFVVNTNERLIQSQKITESKFG